MTDFSHDEQILERRIAELREALELAQAHISWCWDKIEDHTRLRRGGSDDIHIRITRALNGRP